MNRKFASFLIYGLTALAIIVLMMALMPENSSWSPKYVMWKSGLTTIDSDRLSQVLSKNDAEFTSLTGASSKILRSVKGLRLPKDATGNQLSYKLPALYPDADEYFWVGSSAVGIIVKNGKILKIAFFVG